MPHNVRPGDVLADRYRLIDLLTESGGGRFWRAHDSVLARHVALHVIEASDERADGLLEAARRSATIPDRRMLRVLDADRVDGLCFVVNEWGSGSSLDIMVATSGPLSPRRAAWLVSEVASSIAAAHDAGMAHGRLVPENVLVDRTGSVRLIGFCVDAALRGLPAGRVSTDVADLGGLLYCALTGRWPGVSHSDVPQAPHEHGQVLRPRQVRAGIPRPLDALCDAVVNPYATAASAALESHDLSSARGISDYLAAFVGDTTGMAEAEVANHLARAESETVSFTSLPTVPAPESNPEFAPEPEAELEAEPEPDVTPSGVPAPAVPVEQPTQAGLPIFDDELDDVSWLDAPEAPAPPPPPFEDPPERPLFAPEPQAGEPARTPRPGVPTGSQEYWPWGSDTGSGPHTGTGTGTVAVTDEEDEEVPGRSWLRLAGVIGASLLLLIAIVVAYNLGRGKTPLGAEPTDTRSSSSPSESAAPAALLTGLVADDFDPQGDPPEENPDLAPLAVDGDATTAWRSLTYKQNLGPRGLKTGVGLTIDLGESREVTRVDLTLVGEQTGVAIFVTEEPLSEVGDLTPLTSLTAGPEQQITLDEPATGRFVTVWLTSLPQVGGGFRGEVAEVAVRGS